jgi:hypothetical protein
VARGELLEPKGVEEIPKPVSGKHIGDLAIPARVGRSAILCNGRLVCGHVGTVRHLAVRMPRHVMSEFGERHRARTAFREQETILPRSTGLKHTFDLFDSGGF